MLRMGKLSASAQAPSASMESNCRWKVTKSFSISILPSFLQSYLFAVILQICLQANSNLAHFLQESDAILKMVTNFFLFRLEFNVPF